LPLGTRLFETLPRGAIFLSSMAGGYICPGHV